MSQQLLQPNPLVSPPKTRKANRVVLALADNPFAKAAEAHFASAGWDVVWATSSKEGRKWAQKHRAHVAILAVDLGPESGWLSSVKLVKAVPNARVVLVGKERSAGVDQFARFAGAAGFVSESDGVCRLLKAAGVESNCQN